MQNFETATVNPDLRVYFGGGGAGDGAMGYLTAVRQGMIDGVTNGEVVAGVTTADSGGYSGRMRIFSEVIAGTEPGTGTAAVGDLVRSMKDLSDNPRAAGLIFKKQSEDATPDTFNRLADEFIAASSLTSHYREPSDQAETDWLLTSGLELAPHVYDLAKHRGETLRGLHFGHLIMTAAAMQLGIDEASQKMNRLMQTAGDVIPVSDVPHFLYMRDGDEDVYGEHHIDTHKIHHPDDVEMSLYTQKGNERDMNARVPLNPRLADRMRRAGYFVVGRSSFYTSMIPAILPQGTSEIMATAPFRGTDIVLEGNLVTEKTETTGWKAVDYVRRTQEYIPTALSGAVFNTNLTGLAEGAVVYDQAELSSDETLQGIQVEATDLVKPGANTQQENDTVDNRSDVAHDTVASAVAVSQIKVNTRKRHPVAA